ncbi:hypothetical protein LCGC14_0375840 [marine sediment metagenome]|uniref:Uncharacterized protein n=1 Tax=marine sediment metagenome TaxID=412755 RepID=A0A0F9VQZ0_9ZZZZ
MTNKQEWLYYKATLKETKDLLLSAYKATKRRSTIQFTRNRYKNGIINKEQYISILKREAGLVDTEISTKSVLAIEN